MRRQRQAGRRYAAGGFACALLVAAGTLHAVAFAGAGEASPAAPVVTQDQPPANGEATQESARQDANRKRKLRLAILTGGLIAVTGLALVILTILGGSATRRGLRRKPLAERPPSPEPIPADRFDEPEDDLAGAQPGDEGAASGNGER
jgi:hypothetical protein